MNPNEQKLLFDMEAAATMIKLVTAGKTLDDYLSDFALRAIVERQFITLGEALSQLRKASPAVAEQVREHLGIISFRNVLVHGYSRIDHARTWDIVQTKLPMAIEDVRRLRAT